MSHEKQSVLITGCSTGIGRALALEFAGQGLTVYATARKLSAIEDLKEKGISPLQLDVNSPVEIKKAADRVREEKGLDLLINNAGFAVMGPLADISPDRFRMQLETNVTGLLSVTNGFIPQMVERGGGCIVNIGSVSGVMATPFSGAYCASKAAVHALSDALRLELAPFHIKVVTVQPGAIRSHFATNAKAELSHLKAESGLYGKISEEILKRAEESQKNPTSAEAFAKKLVPQLLKENPPAMIRIGKKSRLLPFLKHWVPGALLDRILMKRYRLDTLSG